MAPNLSKGVDSKQPTEQLPAPPSSLSHIGNPNRQPAVSVPHARTRTDAVQTSSDQFKAKSAMVTNVLHDPRAERQREGLGLSEATSAGSHPVTEPAPPSSSLISPPASSNDDIGSSPINTAMLYSPSPPPTKTVSNQAHKEVHQRYTPESGSLRRASSSSFEQRRQDTGQPDVKVSPVSAPVNEMKTASNAMADQESLRLIKELQVQDYGLRKRGKS